MQREKLQVAGVEFIAFEVSYDPDKHLEYLRVVHGVEIRAIVREESQHKPIIQMVGQEEVMVIEFDPDQNYLQMMLKAH
jgi:DNA-binding LacI/PurR family transcriptional regulator